MNRAWNQVAAGAGYDDVNNGYRFRTVMVLVFTESKTMDTSRMAQTEGQEIQVQLVSSLKNSPRNWMLHFHWEGPPIGVKYAICW